MGGRGPESQCWGDHFLLSNRVGAGDMGNEWSHPCKNLCYKLCRQKPLSIQVLKCGQFVYLRKPLWLEANDPGGRVVKRRLRGTWAGPWKASRHTLLSARMPRFPFYNIPQHPLTSSLKILQHLPTVGTMKCNLFSMAPQCWLHIRIPGAFLFK